MVGFYKIAHTNTHIYIYITLTSDKNINKIVSGDLKIII